MITKTGNQLGDDLKTSQFHNTPGPLSSRAHTDRSSESVESDPTNLSSFGTRLSVAYLGLKVNAVMAALDKLRRFEFVKMMQDVGKTSVTLLGQD